METSSHDSDIATCANCGGPLERLEEYALDIAGEGILFYADRCTSCRSEYVNAPEILRPDEELLAVFRPGAGPLGSYRRVMTLASRDPDFRHQLRPRVAAALLGHLLQKDLADVVFVAQQGVSEEPVVAFTKADLFRAGEIRMGPGRSVFTGSGLRANLLTLAQLKRFVETDRGLNPRIAVMGRPCQIYTMRKLRWDRFAPVYELVFALGTYCYGNFSPAAWGGRKLRGLIGFDPVEIRQVEFVGDELRFTSAGGTQSKVGQDDVAGLVNPNCLQCYDFAANFSDMTVGLAGPDELFETAVIRTDRGAQIVDEAIRDSVLTTVGQYYGGTSLQADERRIERYLEAMVEIKRGLTQKLR